MRNYSKDATGMLQLEKSRLEHEIAGWRRTIEEVHSYLIVLYLNHQIKKAEEKIHAIDAELLYREHH